MANGIFGVSTRVAVLACVALLLAGCFGGKPPAAPAPGNTRIKGTIEVAATVNPDARGRPSPVVVKIYDLSAPTAFNSADFFSLFERDKETLGADLVAVEEFQLLPGEKRPFDRMLPPTVRYVSVLAGFRAVETAQWRATLPVQSNKLNQVLIKLEGINASISAVPAPKN